MLKKILGLRLGKLPKATVLELVSTRARNKMGCSLLLRGVLALSQIVLMRQQKAAAGP